MVVASGETVAFSKALQERLRAVARPEETLEALLETMAQEFIARREREAARWEAARAQAQADLNGPFRPHAESIALAYRRLSVLPPPARSPEEIDAEAEAFLDSLPPEKIAELERLGLL